MSFERTTPVKAWESIKLINNEFAVITQLSEAPALDNKKVVFLYKRNAGLIELLENESQKLY